MKSDSYWLIYTVKNNTTRFEKRDTRINRQRSGFKKLVKAFYPVNSAYINSPGLIYCQLIWIIALFVESCVVLDCTWLTFTQSNLKWVQFIINKSLKKPLVSLQMQKSQFSDRNKPEEVWKVSPSMQTTT